jgi:hypothetical protein
MFVDELSDYDYAVALALSKCDNLTEVITLAQNIGLEPAEDTIIKTNVTLFCADGTKIKVRGESMEDSFDDSEDE